MVTLFSVFGYIYRCGYIAWYILVTIIVVVTLLVLFALKIIVLLGHLQAISSMTGWHTLARAECNKSKCFSVQLDISIILD